MGCVQWIQIVWKMIQEGVVKSGIQPRDPKRRTIQGWYGDPETLKQMYAAAGTPYIRGKDHSSSTRRNDRGSGVPS
eukprot:3398461-Ditylum_brightwellii.AAC.1